MLAKRGYISRRQNIFYFNSKPRTEQGRIQELARGGAQTYEVVSRWGEPDFLVQCCIFEAANNHLLVVSHC